MPRSSVTDMPAFGAAAGIPPSYYYATGHAFPTPMVYVLIGDSITDQYRDELQDRTKARGKYEHHATVALGGGILDNDRDNGAWGEYALTLNPDVVVFQSIGNYGLYPTDYAVTYGGPDFFAAMQGELELLCDMFASEGVRLAFIENPYTSGTIVLRQAQTVRSLTLMYKDIAAAHPLVTTINAYDPFGAEAVSSSYRNPDGVHLSATGEHLMAELVERWICFGAPV